MAFLITNLREKTNGLGVRVPIVPISLYLYRKSITLLLTSENPLLPTTPSTRMFYRHQRRAFSNEKTDERPQNRAPSLRVHTIHSRPA